MTTITEWAEYYVNTLGWSIMPINPENKKPLFDWEMLQHRLPKPAELGRWFQKAGVGIGVITGDISKIVVLDIDPRHGGDKSFHEIVQKGIFPTEAGDTPRQRTPSGGWHLVYQHPGRPVKNGTNLYPGLDVRGDGGYFVVGPSVKNDGTGWRWIKGYAPQDRPLKPCPNFLLQRVRNTTSSQSLLSDRLDLKEVILHGVEQGRRDDIGYRLACHWLKDGDALPNGLHLTNWGHSPSCPNCGTEARCLDGEEVTWLLIDFAQKCQPPLPDPEKWASEKVDSAMRFFASLDKQHRTPTFPVKAT